VDHDRLRLNGPLLSHVKSHYQDLAGKAAQSQLAHVEYLAQLIEGEATVRENRAIERRIRQARFPVLKTIEDFQWSWPKKINRSVRPRRRPSSAPTTDRRGHGAQTPSRSAGSPWPAGDTTASRSDLDGGEHGGILDPLGVDYRPPQIT
jgi:IstB-like ATP binding protein